jgi:CheY-like chemotaxis protein
MRRSARGRGRGDAEARQRDDLVVEDNSSVRQSMLRILERQGYAVHFAANGREAIDLIGKRKRPFDLVLSDIVMPELNGYELSDLLAERYPDLKVRSKAGRLPPLLRRCTVPRSNRR